MRALKRAHDERDLSSVKQRDIEKLQAEINELKRKREELTARNAKYGEHSKYLEKVRTSKGRARLHRLVCSLGGGTRR